MRSVRTAIVLSLVLLGTGCDRKGAAPRAEGAIGPQTYTVQVDGPSSAGELFVFGAFYPATLKVRPGDTIVFDNRSSHDIHTVTFGVKPDRSNQPRPETKAVQANPAVFFPCFTDMGTTAGMEIDTGPTADMETCPEVGPPLPAGAIPVQPLYSGRGYWNSGALSPPMAPAPPPKSIEMGMAPDIPPGTYPYVCVIHPFMSGQIEVVHRDAQRLTPAAATKAGEEQFQKAQAEAAKLMEPKLQLPGTTAVAAGWGNRVVAVDRFSPARVPTKAGETVTWVTQSPYMPHTVTFESPFKTPVDPNAFLPGGVKPGSAYEGGLAHSGLFGPAPFLPIDSYSLKFTKPGTYPYVCVLHPGMAGQVDVTA